MEMVRDFFQEYFMKAKRRDERLRIVRDIALAASEGRVPPARCRDAVEACQAQKVTLDL